MLFRVVVNNRVVGFHFAFVLVDNNLCLLGFAFVLVDMIVYRLGFSFAMVGDFVYSLSFVEKNLCFWMLDLIEVVLHGVLVYMVQKYLVDDNHHHLMIDN